jgi:uncharacterized membrane protein YcgQ (UPF0703/DUF1980 family)
MGVADFQVYISHEKLWTFENLTITTWLGICGKILQASHSSTWPHGVVLKIEDTPKVPFQWRKRGFETSDSWNGPGKNES